MANKKAPETNLNTQAGKIPFLRIIAKHIELPNENHGYTITDSPVFARGVMLPLSFTEKDFFKRKGEGSEKATVSVAELTQDSSAQQIFTILSRLLKKIVLTQEQIVTFCKHNEEYLRKEGYGTLFFFKEGDTICYTYVTYMNPNDKGQMLTALLHNELKVGKYQGKFKHRVVYQ